MRSDHLLCLFLVPILQAIILLGAAPINRPALRTDRLFVLLALVVPVACYVWGLRGASFGLKTPRRAVRLAVRGLVAVGLSFTGFIIGVGEIAGELVSGK